MRRLPRLPERAWELRRAFAAWLEQHNDRYSYDALNRLYKLYESGNNSGNTTDTFQFQRQFTFDQWGNRSIDVGNTTPSVPGLTRESCVIDTATNRMTQRNGATLTYDFNGNQNNDSGAQRFYEAENRLSKAGSDNYYYYDASGRRVRRVVGAQETWQVYGFAGELVAEYNLAGAFTGTNAPAAASPTKEYGYRNGQMLVAWDETESDANQKFKWLVSDHLGSTRMEVGGNGSVGTMRRHDYAPFGEEMQGGQRATTGFGYTTAGVREKFTGKERDAETGLDYFGARYFGSTQGRFTSADPLLSSATIYDPQSWNRYSYTLNNPLKYTDPFGLYVYAAGATDEEKKRFEEGLKNLQKARDSFKKGSAEYNRLGRAFNAYGVKGVDNGLTIAFGANKSGAPAATSVGINAPAGTKITTADNPTGQDTRVTIDPIQNTSAADYVSAIGHEGSHVADGSDLVGALPTDLASAAAQAILNGPLNLTKYGTETRAYDATSFIAQARGAGTLTIGPGKYEIWNSGWSEAEKATKRSAGIDKVLARPKNQGGLYEVTRADQGKKLIE